MNVYVVEIGGYEDNEIASIHDSLNGANLAAHALAATENAELKSMEFVFVDTGTGCAFFKQRGGGDYIRVAVHDVRSESEDR